MLQCDHFLGISTLFNEHIAPKEYRQMSMVQSGTVPLLTMANTEKNQMVSFMMISWDFMLPLLVRRQMYLNSYVAFQELVQNLV